MFSRNIELKGVKKDGNIVFIEISVSPVVKDNEIVGVAGVTRDISERKESERDLILSEERYRRFIENAPIGMYTLNTNLEFTYANKKLLDITGYDERDWPQKPFHSLVHHEDLPIVLDKIQRRMENRGTSKPYEIRIYNVTGEIMWVKITSESIYSNQGELIEMQSFVEDITKQKNAEFKMIESERRLKSVFETVALLTVMIDIDGNITFCNNFLLDLTGWRREEVLGKNWFETFLPKDIANGIRTNVFNKMIETGDFPQQYENEIITRNGLKRLIRWNNTIFFGSDGKVETVTSIGEDITEQNKLESQLRQAQKLEAIGTLAGGIAHDFNNILSPIMIHAEMAMMDILPDNAVHHNLQEIFKAGERARDLVKQILTFSRDEEGKRAVIRITPVFKDLLKLIRSTLPTTIDIQQKLEAESDTVFADPTQLNQVLLNLCTNAAHAMREKGGTLSVSLVQEDLDSETTEQYHDLDPGSYFRLTVSDTGHGMDDQTMQRIFEPYFTTNKAGEGTGLGLAVIHGIVKSYNGDILVESEVGKGTSFNVYFPRVEEEIQTIPEVSIQLPKGTERILFIDDEKGTVDAIQSMLENLGYYLTTRTSSIEALEVFRNNPNEFDLVITDMTMPNMTGKDLAKEMMSIRYDIPIILCTGFSERIDENLAKAMGISAYVMKPIIMRELANTIREVLDNE